MRKPHGINEALHGIGMKNMMVHPKIDCKMCRSHLPELLFDEGYLAEHDELAVHMIECTTCRFELEDLRATYALLDMWHAPEPSTYFDVKLHARLREASVASPAGFWNRMRSYLLYSTERGMRPVMAGALAIVLVLGGGGTFLELHQYSQVQAQISPAVNDLKIMDSNAQALQQMDQLLDPNKDDESAPPVT